MPQSDSEPVALEESSAEAHSVFVHRPSRTVYLLDAAGRVVHEEPAGVGRGGVVEKRDMGDQVTPTGVFSVDLVLTAKAEQRAVSEAAVRRYVTEPEYADLLGSSAGLGRLFEQMNALDFDRDGDPDGAYGSGYIGLTSDEAVTGPKMRRYQGTAYWFSIALHGTPHPANLGAANSGGCVHLSASLLRRLIDGRVVQLGSVVEISDTLPALTPAL